MDKIKALEIIGVDENANDSEKTDAYYKRLKNTASGYVYTDKDTGEPLTKEVLKEAFAIIMKHEKVHVDVTKKDKVSDFFHYNGLKIFIIFVAIFLIGSAVFIKLNKPTYDLRILFIGDKFSVGDTLTLENTINAKMPELKNIKVEHLDLGFSREAVSVIFQRTQTQISTGDFDILICDRENFITYANTGAFEDLDPIFQQMGVSIDETTKKYEKNIESDTPVLYGVDVTNNKQIKIENDDESIVKILSLSFNPNSKENSRAFIKMIFGE